MSKILEKLQPAELYWDENGQPFSLQFNDVYFSRSSGLEETRHVFLEANNLQQRFARLESNRHFVIAETGFGTGLNFLAAWQSFLQHAPKTAQLYFISTEKHPLTASDLEKSLQLWPELAVLSEALIAGYPPHIQGCHYRQLESGRIHLLLCFGDASEALGQLLDSDHPAIRQTPERRVDAWFLDGFAPAKNPALWTPELINTIRQLSGEGTTAATFTAAGDVRRALQSAGFTVKKVPGFGSKREMITASLHQVANESASGPEASSTSKDPRESRFATPWQLSANPISKPENITLIGSGIAACTLARSLALKGINVTLLERNPTIASEASGNPQAILYSKLSSNDGPLSRFVMASLPHSLHYYQNLQASSADTLFEACGLLQLAYTEKMQQNLQALASFFRDIDNRLVEFPDTAQASALAGLPVTFPASYLPGSGWINPARVCCHLLDHPLIQLKTQHQVTSLQLASHHGWQIAGQTTGATTEHFTWQSDCVVIAAGYQSNLLSPAANTPLKPIRGQVSFFPANTFSERLSTVICGDGYIAPASEITEGHHSIGATYHLQQNKPEVTAEDHKQNLDTLQKMHDGLAATFSENTHMASGRVGFRGTTPDYLPICGPVPDEALLNEVFSPLLHNARASLNNKSPCFPGLFVHTGFGSRGFTYAPLCAEVMTAHILGTPFPLPQDLIKALSPSRFAVRKLQKKQL